MTVFVKLIPPSDAVVSPVSHVHNAAGIHYDGRRKGKERACCGSICQPMALLRKHPSDKVLQDLHCIHLLVWDTEQNPCHTCTRMNLQ
jgi:hypothetical protein